MASMRLFVAIVPPPAVQAELARRLAPLQAEAAPGLRWTSQESWHITLAFLGEVREEVVPELSTRLERAARRAVVVNTGTKAFVPPVDGLDATPYWINRQAIVQLGAVEAPGANPLFRFLR